MKPKLKLRNVFFLLSIFVFPLWIPFLIIMMNWDVALNFKDQINKGHYRLMK